MQVWEFEHKVRAIDDLTVIVRAPRNTVIAAPFAWVNAAVASTRITKYGTNRLDPCLGALEWSIVDGSGKEPHGGSRLDTVRASYQ
jgi:hypothetical protein